MTVVPSSRRIVILLPMVWSVRNAVYSGVVKHLADAGISVTLLMRDLPTDMSQSDFADFAAAAGCETLIAPVQQRRTKGKSFLREVLHSAHNQRSRIASFPIYQRWLTRHNNDVQRRYQRIVDALSRVVRLPVVFPLAVRFYSRMQAQELGLEAVSEQLQRLQPDAIWSTTNIEIEYEPAYKLAADKLRIPVVTSILSFDNLTSKSLHLTYTPYDHYLVWNGRMKDQLLQIFPHVSAEQVTITGTPQFDFHRRAEYRWSREQTLSQLGLPSGSRYFLYASSVISLAPAEPELLMQLIQRMKSDPVLKDYWIVVRHHPKDSVSRWKAIEAASDRVKLSHPWSTRSESEPEYWALATKQDQARLVSSLAHAEACLNIASTTTLDAAILDRPVIGIRFEYQPDAPSEILYEEYDATHFKPLVESGGLRVAANWKNLFELMRRAVENPDADRAERASMVEMECGVVDGDSARRTAQALVAQLDV